MNTRIIVSAAFVALALAGCGSINNVTVSDRKLQERAAFALGVSPNAVKSATATMKAYASTLPQLWVSA